MTTLCSFLRAVLPDGIGFAAGAIDQRCADLTGLEREAVATASAKRRREFSAGRACARAALAELGCPVREIAVAADRGPIWPEGYVGSITHSDTLCAAIAGFGSTFAGLGLDIEPATPLEENLRPIVCRTDERHRLRPNTGSGFDDAKFLFVAKEAVFKAYYPATRAFLEFQDVRIDLDDQAKSFAATLMNSDIPSVAGLRCFEGRFGVAEAHAVAVVVIRGAQNSERLTGAGP